MPFARIEMLRKEMIAAGNRLTLALSVENDFELISLADELAEKQWMQCRTTVDEFAQDYATAIDHWRAAVEDAAGITRTEGTGAVPKQPGFFRFNTLGW